MKKSEAQIHIPTLIGMPKGKKKQRRQKKSQEIMDGNKFDVINYTSRNLNKLLER